MNEIIREFLIETNENLGQMDQDLITLEKNPTERETLARVFRALHTIKGTAGFLGFQKLQSVAHVAETLLSRLRDGELVFNQEIATGLLAVVDAVREMLGQVERSGTDGGGDYSDQIQLLERLLAGGGRAQLSAVSEITPATIVRAVTPSDVPAARASLHPSVVSAPSVSEMAEARAPAVSESAIRVDVGLLDKLMTLVGELVLARNQIMQLSESPEGTALQGTVQRLNLLTSELQAGVMKTRMQPISNIWSKFPRVVRDLAAACGKEAHIEMEGQETELDRTIIEAIRDPLTHLVRNAVDHGIEQPSERSERGKPAEGRLKLHAFHEGGKVMIEISDDGAGIDPQRVRAKAIQAQVVASEHADRMSDGEVLNLIFQPGFSTADKVTQFSGRGVGMDVVRTNIEKIGGAVAIESRIGEGTTVRMNIPLTLAIIPALTVTCCGDRYAIPQVNLLELVRLEEGQLQPGIEWIQGSPVYRLRGNLLPLVFLAQQLWQQSLVPSSEEVNIVVLQADDRQFGLIVDGIHDTEEIVVKPLQKQIKSISVFSGATIMGDGKVALILDVLGLAQRASVIRGVRQRVPAEPAIGALEPAAERQTVLLVASSDGGRMALPLSSVARLEEFPRSAIERVGPQEVVQYRNEILPLIDVSRTLARRRRVKRRASQLTQTKDAVNDTVSVVVCGANGLHVGLVVDHIIDIADETLISRGKAHRPGVMFTSVVQGRVTEFLDVDSILRGVDPDVLEPAQSIAAEV
jgi:two-component system chemotaxis sensor kinase CheA